MAANAALRHRRALRALLAGPGTLAATAAMVPGMVLWLPQGPAGVDQIAVPLVLLPLVWIALFFYACLDPSLRRVALILAVLSFGNGLALAVHVATLPPAASAS